MHANTTTSLDIKTSATKSTRNMADDRVALVIGPLIATMLRLGIYLTARQGANRGVGLALVKALIESGYRVWGSVRPQTIADASVGDLRETGAQTVEIDYTDEKTILKAAKFLEKSEKHLDLLVNCGGVNTKPRQWDGGEAASLVLEKFKVMALGPFLATLHFLPLLKKCDLGKVLNISSDLASIAGTDGGRLSYRMAKAALNQQTASLAADFKEKGINVALVAVHPGRVPTRMSGGSGTDDLVKSVRCMVKIAKDLDMQTSGRYLKYDGSELPW
ncbi:hypothetical protein O1611_g1027 [Lasiodiplodia mahajangana]|uniref:Uncharacterized protein n=1 Tax=Lasiodiplodia mahajangana TaxID=1108764 RepID=A0ACC2JYP8_9PEZI|nr:hypothetical protein O1611_g1027 [Lasiodiplodia mahajangana]